MVCPQCTKQGYNHDEIVQLCESSPLWTGILLCGLDWLDNPFHHAIDQWFMKKYNSGSRRFIIMTPRGHLKTSYFGTAFLTWKAITDPEARAVYRNTEGELRITLMPCGTNAVSRRG